MREPTPAPAMTRAHPHVDQIGVANAVREQSTRANDPAIQAGEADVPAVLKGFAQFQRAAAIVEAIPFEGRLEGVTQNRFTSRAHSPRSRFSAPSYALFRRKGGRGGRGRLGGHGGRRLRFQFVQLGGDFVVPRLQRERLLPEIDGLLLVLQLRVGFGQMIENRRVRRFRVFNRAQQLDQRLVEFSGRGDNSTSRGCRDTRRCSGRAKARGWINWPASSRFSFRSTHM